MKHIFKFVQHHSWPELLKRVRIAATRRLFEKRSIFIMKIKLEAVAEPDPILEIKELTRSNIDLMLDVMYLSQADLYDRFDIGDRCFAVIDRGEIATYVWAQFDTKRMDELRLVFKLKPNQAWFYNAVTVKSARGRGYYPNIMRYTAKALRAEGFDELFGYSESQNLASIRGLEKAGYVPVVLIHMKKVLSSVNYKLTIFDKDFWRKLSDTIEYFERMQYVVDDKTCS